MTERIDLRGLPRRALTGYGKVASEILESDDSLTRFCERMMNVEEVSELVSRSDGGLGIFLTGVAVGIRLAGTKFASDA